MEPTNLDPLLRPLLAAHEEEQVQKIIETLFVDQLNPMIEQIIWRKLRGGQSTAAAVRTDFADLKSEITVKILGRLAQLRTPSAPPIEDLRAYVASVSYRCCADYFRHQFPHRHRHKNRVRYLLMHQPELGLFSQAEEEWIGGLHRWENEPFPLLSTVQFEQLVTRSLPVPLQNIPDPTFKRHSPVAQVSAIFEWAKAFISLDDLVAILAVWWEVQDGVALSAAQEPGYEEHFIEKLISRAELQILWSELAHLSVRQRQALMLGLQTTEQAALLYFPAFQLASFTEIAAALEFTPTMLAEIWNYLPLSDNQIAAYLDLTRQQVINLRRTAREKLSRKLGKKQK